MKNMDVLMAQLVGHYCPSDFFKQSRDLEKHMETNCAPEEASCRECWKAWLDKEVTGNA